MALIEINRNPSRRDLAWFGLVLLALSGVIGLLAWRATGRLAVPQVIWSAGVVIAIAYYAIPAVRRPLFVGWMYVSYPIGWVVSHVLLAVAFYGIMSPVGLLMRAFGYDPLSRRFDQAARSYWVTRERIGDVKRYFRQF